MNDNIDSGKLAAPHGGKRTGCGRPALIDNAVRINMWLSAEQREKMRRNGGSAWLRDLIDAAPEILELPKKNM